MARFLAGLLACVLAIAAPIESVQSLGLGREGAGFGRLGALRKVSSTSPVTLLNDNFVAGTYSPGPAASNDLVDTRASNQWAPNLDGTLTEVGSGVLAIGTAGLLNETSSQNIVIQSNALNNASWTKTAVTATDGQVGPDGNTTATLLANTSTNSETRAAATIGFSTNQTRTFSAYIKIGTGATWVFAGFSDDSANSFANYFNISTCAIGSPSTAGFGVVASATTGGLTTSGWCHVIVTGHTTNNANMYPQIRIVTSNGSISTTSGQSVLVWTIQVETASVASSPIQTTSAAVTRPTNAVTIQHTGIGTCTFTFSDNSTETILTAPAVNDAIPNNLNKTVIKQVVCTSAAAALRQAAATTFYPDTTTAGNAQVGTWFSLIAQDQIDAVKVAIPNCSAGDNSTSGTLTATAGLNVNGQFFPFKFSGSSSGSTSGCLLWSDELSLPASVVAGATFTIRTWGSSSNSTFATADNFNNGVNLTQFGATVPDTTTGTGSLTNSSAGVFWPVAAVVGRHNGKAICIYGDSIAYGIGTSNAPHGILDALGNTVPVINMGIPGYTVQGLLAGPNTAFVSLASSCTSYAMQLGINDLNAGRTSAQILADRASFAALLPTPSNMVQTTITPSANSSDNFATAVNQTTLAYNPARQTLNTAVLAMPKFVNTASPLEDVTGTGIWKNVGDSSAAAATTSTNSPWQGIHPLPFGYGLVSGSGNVNPALFN